MFHIDSSSNNNKNNNNGNHAHTFNMAVANNGGTIQSSFGECFHINISACTF